MRPPSRSRLVTRVVQWSPPGSRGLTCSEERALSRTTSSRRPHGQGAEEGAARLDGLGNPLRGHTEGEQELAQDPGRLGRRGVAEAAQVGEDPPVGVVGAALVGPVHGEGRLADTGGPRDEADGPLPAAYGTVEGGQFGTAPGEAARRPRQPLGRRDGDGNARTGHRDGLGGTEQRRVRLAERLPGVDAQLLGEQPPGAVVPVDRVRLGPNGRGPASARPRGTPAGGGRRPRYGARRRPCRAHRAVRTPPPASPPRRAAALRGHSPRPPGACCARCR